MESKTTKKNKKRKQPREQRYLYVLLLKPKKLYIGITNSPIRRITEHLEGFGSKVTNKCKVHKIVKLYKLPSKPSPLRIERTFTNILAEKLGHNNVTCGLPPMKDRKFKREKASLKPIINTLIDECDRRGILNIFIDAYHKDKRITISEDL